MRPLNCPKQFVGTFLINVVVVSSSCLGQLERLPRGVGRVRQGGVGCRPPLPSAAAAQPPPFSPAVPARAVRPCRQRHSGTVDVVSIRNRLDELAALSMLRLESGSLAAVAA